MEEGNPVFIVDTKEMLSSFTKTISEVSGINDNFTSVSIIKHESNYFLVFLGNKHKSVFRLDVVEGMLAPVDMHIACTTSECASEQWGCVPTGDVTPSCTRCANNGKCTKTTSSKNLFTYGKY